MKRILLLLFFVMVLIIAYFTKPDDKTCTIAAVKAVWGNRVPDLSTPEYFNQFMDVTSKNVTIHDWWFLKSIRYRVNEKKEGIVAFGAFKHIFITYQKFRIVSKDEIYDR